MKSNFNTSKHKRSTLKLKVCKNGRSHVFTVEFCPAKKIGWSLIPSTSDHNLIWKQGLYKGNQVKIRSLVWALIQHNQWLLFIFFKQCPLKRGEFGHRDIHRGKTTWKWPSTSQRNAWSYQILKERPETNTSWEISETVWLLWYLNLGSIL